MSMFKELRYLEKNRSLNSSIWEGKWNYEVQSMGDLDERIEETFSEPVIIPFLHIQSEPWLDYEKILINALRESFYDLLEKMGVTKISIYNEQIIVFKGNKQIRDRDLEQYSGCLYIPRQQDETSLSKAKFIAKLAYKLVETMAYIKLFVTHSETILAVMLDQRGLKSYQNVRGAILPCFEVLNEAIIMSVAKKVIHGLTYESLKEVCKSEEEMESIKFMALETFNLSPYLAYYYIFVVKNELASDLMSDFLLGTDRAAFKLFEEGKGEMLLPWILMERNQKSLFKAIRRIEGENARGIIKAIKSQGAKLNRETI